MATATIKAAFCVRPASGTDLGGVAAVAELADEILASDFGPGALFPKLSSIPGIIAAIDRERDDPDNFYITLGTEGDVSQRVWPTDRETVPLRGGQSVAPDLEIEFDSFQNVSLWDFDTVSRDDLLGSITLSADESGQGEKAKLAKSDIEGSVYYIVYEVD
ncbi:MAG: hypothetical protein U1E46_12960 [Hyphomicrobiales bacterium]